MRRLSVISVSHYCEKARWALQRAALDVTEERFPPVFHVFAAKRRAGSQTVPVLQTDDETLTESSQIVRYADRGLPPEARLVPDDEALRADVERWERRFDDDLGPHTRRWAYVHLLYVPTAYPLLLEGVPFLRRTMARLTKPLIRKAMSKFLRLSPAGGARSKAKIDEVFAEVSDALSDGRNYLVGDRFTSADLTFAALAAPALCPPEYGAPLPPFDTLPPAMHAEVEAFRATPAGAFGLRLYAEERAKIVGT